MNTIWYWHFHRVCDKLLLSILDASYSLSWLATPISLYHRRLFNVVLTASTYPILPSIAGGLGFFIHFKHHKYFMLYRIEDGKVYIDGIYHDSQDYENIAR